MASKFGGVPVAPQAGSRFGGTPVPLVNEQGQNVTDRDFQRLVEAQEFERMRNPTGNFGEDLAAGLGKSVIDPLLGLRQLAVEGAGVVSDDADRYGQQLRAEQDERARLDVPLMRSPGGVIGHTGGTVAQVIGPGILARGTAAGAALLPRSIAGNTAQGAVIGAVQPVGTEDSRLGNVALGGGAGFGGSTLGAILGGGWRGTRAIVEPFTEAGQERIAARAIQSSAADPSVLLRPDPSRVAGVTRNLAEETADPGVATLQRGVAASDPTIGGQFAARDAANNAARVQAVQSGFEGADQASIDALELEARKSASRAAQQLRNVVNPAPIPVAPVPFNPFGSLGVGAPPAAPVAQAAKAIDLQPVDDLLGKLVNARRGNETVQKALQRAQGVIRRTQPRDAKEAWNIRQELDNIIQGTGDDTSGRAARRELTLAKAAIDRQMTRAFPGWGQFLKDYKGQMARADQARTGQRLLEGSTGTRAFDKDGNPLLTPANLREGRNADRLVAQATGFPRARAERTLTPPQRTLLDDLAEDSDRILAAQNAARGPGSNTAQNLATMNFLRSLAPQSRIAEFVLSTQPAQRLATLGEKGLGVFGIPARLQAVTADLLQNPARAREVLERLPAADRSIVSEALTRTLGAGGALTPALGQ